MLNAIIVIFLIEPIFNVLSWFSAFVHGLSPLEQWVGLGILALLMIYSLIDKIICLRSSEQKNQ